MTNSTKGEAPVIGPTEASVSNQTSNGKTDMDNFNAQASLLATADSMTASATGTSATTLIPVFTGTLHGRSVQLCDARTLHTFMGVLRDFTDWVKARIRKFEFIEGVDFLKIIGSPEKGNQTRGGNKKETTDYHLSLDMAKELSMVENNAKGREARRYFMECEKQVLAALTAHPNDRIAYSVSPNDTLTASQAEQLRLAFKARCEAMPKEKQGAFMTKGWSKLKSHFGCTYRKIPQREFSEALSLANRHAAEWELMDDSSDHALTKEQADTLRDMMIEASKAMPKDLQGPLMHEGCLKLKDHFKVDYCEIPQSRFSEAVALVSRHIVHFNGTKAYALPEPEPIKSLDIETLVAFINGGLIDHSALLQIADASGMALFVDVCSEKDKGWGEAVAAQIDETLPQADLRAIVNKSVQMLWMRALQAAKTERAVPQRSQFVTTARSANVLA